MGAACDAAEGEEDEALPVYEAEDPEPEWTAEDVGAQVETFFGWGMPVPYEVGTVFRELLESGDEDCPGDPQMLDELGTHCVSAEGYAYDGIGWMVVESYSEGMLAYDWAHGGDFTITRPDGTIFGGGGGIAYQTTSDEDAGVLTHEADVHGTWIDDARSDWLGQEFSAVIQGVATGDIGSRTLTLDGGMGVGDIDLAFEAFTFDQTGPCGDQPTGTIQVRDTRGYWYAWELGDDCDACGPVTFHEEVGLGDVCVELEPIAPLAFDAWFPR